MGGFVVHELWLLDSGGVGSQPWTVLLVAFVQSAAAVSPRFTVFLVVVEEATPVAEYGHSFILEGNPQWFGIADVYESAPRYRLAYINVDPNPDITTSAFSTRRCVNLFNLSQGSSDSISVGFVHTAKRQVVYLDPERGMIKFGVFNRCRVCGFIEAN